MKKIVLTLLLLSIFIVGCSNVQNFPEKKDKGPQMGEEIRNMHKRNGRFGGEGFNEEQRQQMMEEMQQKMIDACQSKIEGESCQLEGHMSEMQGTCSIENENLVCKFERPDRSMRQMP